MKIENKTPIAEEIIRNNPTGHGLFAGIGDNFNSVAQVICELMDDAVSNLRANKDDPELSMAVVLSLENLGNAVEITVTDGGTGIADLSSALTIACRDGAQTPLNEHGFGQCIDHRMSGWRADAAERARLWIEARIGLLRQQS